MSAFDGDFDESDGGSEEGHVYDRSQFPGVHCGKLHRDHPQYKQLSKVRSEYGKVMDGLRYLTRRAKTKDSVKEAELQSQKQMKLSEAWAIFDTVESEVVAASLDTRVVAACEENIVAAKAVRASVFASRKRRRRLLRQKQLLNERRDP